MSDVRDADFDHTSIAVAEEAIAALVRQLDRAVAAHDDIAVAVEKFALCLQTQTILHHCIRIASKGSDEWLFVYGLLDGWVVERRGLFEVTVTAQTWCSPTWRGTDDWPEPFEADFRLSSGLDVLADYTIRFGRRSTLNDLDARAAVAAGNLPPPCPPSAVTEWVYVFRGPGESTVKR